MENDWNIGMLGNWNTGMMGPGTSTMNRPEPNVDSQVVGQGRAVVRYRDEGESCRDG
jgi:hypothetical protein